MVGPQSTWNNQSNGMKPQGAHKTRVPGRVTPPHHQHDLGTQPLRHPRATRRTVRHDPGFVRAAVACTSPAPMARTQPRATRRPFGGGTARHPPACGHDLRDATTPRGSTHHDRRPRRRRCLTPARGPSLQRAPRAVATTGSHRHSLLRPWRHPQHAARARQVRVEPHRRAAGGTIRKSATPDRRPGIGAVTDGEDRILDTRKRLQDAGCIGLVDLREGYGANGRRACGTRPEMATRHGWVSRSSRSIQRRFATLGPRCVPRRTRPTPTRRSTSRAEPSAAAPPIEEVPRTPWRGTARTIVRRGPGRSPMRT